MAKELSKVGIQTGQDIEAHHVTQSVDAFTGLDAYDVTISGSLEVTGSISTDSTVYANALNLEGGNIQYYPANDLLKFGDNIKLGIGVGAGTIASDIEISSDGNEGYISSNTSNLTLQSGGGDTIIRNTKSGKNIILQPDETGGGASGGVLISGSSPNVSLDVRGPITGSSNISASGDIYGDNFIAANNITASANISASGDIFGLTISASNDLYIGNEATIENNLTFKGTNSLITLGENSDIKMGTQFLLDSQTSKQQLSINPYDIRTNTSKGIELKATSNGNGQSILLQEVDGSTISSSLLMKNFPTYAVIQADWETPNTISDIFYILSNGENYTGNTKGQIYFGNGTENATFQMSCEGGTNLTNSNYGFKIASGGALEVNSDQVYNNGGVVWGTTSDSRLKENIITASIDVCYDNVKKLPLMYYKWKDEMTETPLQDQNVLGWVAQDVKSIFPKAVQTGEFTTWSTYTGSEAITGSNNERILEPGERYQDVLAGSEIIEDRHTLQADQIIKMMYGAIQKLQEKVEALEVQISGSNS